MAAVAAGLVLGTALILTPLATQVWTTAMVPAADRSHYGDALTPALAVAGFGLYLIVSALFVRRRTYVLVEPCRPRSEDPAAGVSPPRVPPPPPRLRSDFQ